MEIIGDLDSSTELQRYMSFPKFIDLIDRNKIFLSKASCFEDKLEGCLTFESDLLRSGDAMLYDIAVSFSMPTVRKLTEEEKEQNDKLREDASLAYDNRVHHTVFGDIPDKEMSHEVIYNKYNEWIDVSCWHSNEHESMAMWKIYGGDDCAVCIVTDLERLINSIVESSDYKLIIAKIAYISHQNDSFTYDHILSQYMHKAHFYSYENEVRILGYNPSTDIRGERMSFGTDIDINLSTLIKEIRVSPTAPNWFFNVVKSLCDKYSLNVKVNRSEIY
ncbi:DUF2971 domain-containing protein [Brenneria rubrifaciens]|uniref:DUF2971 domain-containing protein n=1 Tax=Brenneria rubrifaciens TaxID=55213 RepID=A0A4P8R0B5_9GAMM|nr:DUF2971 domain-containing protein [Brenneria rubrifaciens]QCR10005.1 DUF2971 domain-containing protein [Brenneria rubrifaciens]